MVPPAMGFGNGSSSLTVVSCLFVAACSSGGSSGGGSGGSAGSGGSGGVTSTDPLVLVPPEPLQVDAAECPATFQAGMGDGQQSGFEVAGQSRSFLLRLPAADGPRPLMVVFNGTGEDGQAIYTRAHMQDFVDAGFVVLAPDSAGNGTLWPVWDGLREPGHENDPNADLDFFDALVRCTAAHHAIDAKRIYVSGHSAGGIFSNYVLQRRSELLAGGIPASGVFDLTAPAPQATLDDIAVLVTWGGDNDAWSGSAGGVSVPSFSFVEQAALASQYYEANVEQAYCRGKNLGHAWLSQGNGFMIDYLLAHPKGLAKSSPWQLVAPPQSANYECGDTAASASGGVVVSCGSSTTAGCQAYCQLLGDCAVENATIEPVLGPQLEKLGFSGAGHTECGGCVAQCETDAAAGGSLDAGVLSCFETAAASAQCGAGISGAMPLVDATNSCCQGKQQSQVCSTLCGTIKTNSSASILFSTCSSF